MNEFGINETKLYYVCSRCEQFSLKTRQIGDEKMPKKRRALCGRCQEITIFYLQPEEKKDKS